MYIVERLFRDEEKHEALVDIRPAVGGPEQGGKPERFRVTLADCDLLGLEAGVTLSEELYAELCGAQDRLACVQKAFVFLSYGDLSRKRLIEKLRRTFPPELCEQTADRLEERGYLNDLRLAERYAESYYEIRSYGPMRIRQELYGKGFSREVIEQVMEPYQELDHREKIAELLEKRYPRETLSDPAVRRRATDWLRRNGYGWTEISDVLRSS